MQVPSLAFPCGVAPGFDPTHPAAASTLLSAIASGGNMVSIVGKPGVAAGLTSTPTAVIDVKIGPATTYAQGGGQNSAWAGFATNTPSAFTMAAICVPVTHGGAAQCLVYDNPSGTGGTKSGLLWNNTGVAKWGISTSSFISTSTTPNVVVGVPYFVAASMLSAVGFNLVAARLDTGQITSEFVSSATTLAA